MSEPRADARPNLKDYSPEALQRRFASEGLPRFRAQQVAGWLYRRGVDDPDRMTDLDRPLRAWLAGRWRSRALEIARVDRASDGTLKGVLRAVDGALVEAVIIPEESRTTLCVSTQVGCSLACAFCATGALGLLRNLTTAEIVDQVCTMRRLLPQERSLTNVVFMGMGEPLLNLPAVTESIRTLLHPAAFGLAPRRVTVSTAGVAPRIRPLVEAVPVNLAVSLHAATDVVRDRLVPLNRRFPLRVLFETLARLPGLSRRRPVFFEYTLIEGVNDSLEDARRLLGLLRRLPAKLNLIPMNPHPESPYGPPDPNAIDRFMGVLAHGGATVTLRRSRGADIAAACGQLAVRSSASGRRAVRIKAPAASDEKRLIASGGRCSTPSVTSTASWRS